MSQSIDTGPRTTVRTIVASFLFNDLVGFSKGTAAEQHAAKTRLTAVLRRNLSALQQSDYWIKDTGDGALIAFVSNPEHALYIALAIEHDYDGATDSLRTGLHLGTVKESIDLEGRRNFIGDGINAAKRIMDFAHPGQITASRSFFEAIANLDAAYAPLFEHLGAPDDKHGRSHELYAVSPSTAVLEKLKADFAADAVEAADPAVASAAAAAAEGAPARAGQGASTRFSRPALLIAIATALLLGIAAIYYGARQPEPAPAAQPALSQPAPGPVPASIQPGSIEPANEQASAPNRGGADGVTKKLEPDTTLSPPTSAPATMPRASAPSNAASAARPRPPVSMPAPTPNAASSESSSPRCSRIIQKAALGEPLTPEEKMELSNSCR